VKMPEGLSVKQFLAMLQGGLSSMLDESWKGMRPRKELPELKIGGTGNKRNRYCRRVTDAPKVAVQN
jgi:hypothetical protein